MHGRATLRIDPQFPGVMQSASKLPLSTSSRKARGGLLPEATNNLSICGPSTQPMDDIQFSHCIKWYRNGNSP